ncbi:hypothetical protein EO238_25255, partial [Citrobacter sp. AAK_AS5]
GTPERSSVLKKLDPRSAGFTADTPVPYRLADLIALIAERMGKLENDPLHLVALGDASLRDPAAFATQVRFAVNRKKDAVFKGGAELDSQAERQ